MTLSGHTASLVNLTSSPDGRYIATSSDSPQTSGAGADASVKIWNADTGQALFSFSPNPDRALGLAFSPDGNLLAISGSGGFISVWDMATGEKLIDLTGKTDTVGDVAFPLDGQRLVTAGIEVSIWDLATGTELVSVTPKSGGGVALTQDGRWLYANNYGEANMGVYTLSLEDVLAWMQTLVTVASLFCQGARITCTSG